MPEQRRVIRTKTLEQHQHQTYASWWNTNWYVWYRKSAFTIFRNIWNKIMDIFNRNNKEGQTWKYIVVKSSDDAEKHRHDSTQGDWWWGTSLHSFFCWAFFYSYFDNFPKVIGTTGFLTGCPWSWVQELRPWFIKTIIFSRNWSETRREWIKAMMEAPSGEQVGKVDKKW